jgi:hypothetical protein
LHRVRSRLVSQRTGAINQIRGFLIERGITVRQGPAPLRKALSEILSCNSATLSPWMVHLITDLAEDWRRLDNRIATVSAEIEALAEQDGSLPTSDDRAGYWTDHLERCRSRDRQWHWLQAGTWFWRSPPLRLQLTTNYFLIDHDPVSFLNRPH